MTNEYRYTECGLDNVIIEGARMVIDDAGEDVVCISNVASLHRAIAYAIISHAQGMSGEELRFLRTELGYTQDELAEILSVTRLTIGRWERGQTSIDAQAEFIIRMLTAEKLEIDIGMSVEEMAKRCGWRAERTEIRIDGSDPANYRPLAA